MTTLYKLTEQMQSLKELLNSDEIPENAIADTMEGIQGEFDDKAKAIMYLVRNTDTDIDGIKSEVKRLNDRAKVLQNQQDRIKEYLRFNMSETGINKIECELFTITLSKARKVVIIDDIKKLPKRLQKKVTTITCDKNDIKKELDAGLKTEGAHIEDGKRGLTIK